MAPAAKPCHTKLQSLECVRVLGSPTSCGQAVLPHPPVLHGLSRLAASSEFPGGSAFSGYVARCLKDRPRWAYRRWPRGKSSPLYCHILLLTPALFRHSINRAMLTAGVSGTALTGHSHSCSISRGPVLGTRSTPTSGSSSSTAWLSDSRGVRKGGSKGTSV